MHNTARQRLVQSDTNYGGVTDNTIRTASQIGNSSGPADFGAGLPTAQTLRVVLALGSESGGTSGVFIYDESPAAPIGITTAVVSYIPGVVHFLKRVSFSGSSDAEFILKIDGVVVDKKRNNWCDRNGDFDYGPNGIPVEPGKTVALYVLNLGKTASAFNGTIYGEEV